MTITIGLLLMDELPESAQHVRGSYPALYRHMFDDHDVELLQVDVHLGDAPSSLHDADVWVLTGSRYAVYDDLPWIRTACELTAAAIAAEHPLVGLCFGHQLFAQALGGRVERAAEWGVGVRSFRTVAPLPWLPEPLPSAELITSHQDQVVEVPPDATVWCTADYCPNAGLIIGERAFSVQGHPELTADVAHALYEGRRSALGDAVVDEARASLERPVSSASITAAIVRMASGGRD